MVSWTLGGWPSPVLDLLSQPADEALAKVYGADAKLVAEAGHRFSAAFREFPFDIGTAYTAPQNCGPRNLLFAEPSGYHATMVGYPYDDLTAWRAIYPEQVFEDQLRRLSDGWRAGLEQLAAYLAEAAGAGFPAAPERPALAGQMLLPDEVCEHLRPHPVRQRAMRLAFEHVSPRKPR